MRLLAGWARHKDIMDSELTQRKWKSLLDYASGIRLDITSNIVVLIVCNIKKKGCK